MAIKLPNSWDIRAISEEIGLDLEEEEILEYIELMGPAIESYNYIDKVPDNIPNDQVLKDNLGKPLTDIPDPFKKYNSFGEHNNEMLKEFLKKF